MVEQTGLPTDRTRRPLDPAMPADTVATQNAITQLIAASALVTAHCHAHNYAAPGKPKIA
ncbi:hypothetical protein [Spongiactinospora rosea]|uniref:hypothetical protein n=1 Tax=Spongiactinospora rosea TaxID=2248750 RepID=UPI0011C06A7D|nr:hypothetical protein [Spongiactinospora rosea]